MRRRAPNAKAAALDSAIQRLERSLSDLRPERSAEAISNACGIRKGIRKSVGRARAEPGTSAIVRGRSPNVHGLFDRATAQFSGSQVSWLRQPQLLQWAGMSNVLASCHSWDSLLH